MPKKNKNKKNDNLLKISELINNSNTITISGKNNYNITIDNFEDFIECVVKHEKSEEIDINKIKMINIAHLNDNNMRELGLCCMENAIIEYNNDNEIMRCCIIYYLIL